MEKKNKIKFTFYNSDNHTSFQSTQKPNLYFLLLRFLFFYCFLYQQFITRCVKADRGSYFRNYVHERQTNRKLEDKKKKRKEKKN